MRGHDKKMKLSQKNLLNTQLCKPVQNGLSSIETKSTEHHVLQDIEQSPLTSPASSDQDFFV